MQLRQGWLKFLRQNGTIKHNDSKFRGIYQNVKDLYENGCNEDHTIHEYLALRQLKHPKVIDFAFEHCWLIRGRCHIEQSFSTIVRTPESLKKKCFANALLVSIDLVMDREVADESIWSASVTHQPQTSSSSGSK